LPARGPPTDWGEPLQMHDEGTVFQASPDDLSAISQEHHEVDRA